MSDIIKDFDNDKSTAFFKSIGERISIRKLEQLRKEVIDDKT